MMNKVRELFDILNTSVYGKPLIYFDNAATTQKPRSVIDTLTGYYTTLNSNIHRGAHYLSTTATEAYEQSRRKVQSFINAKHPHEIVFTRGTTESINLVASSFAKRFLADAKTQGTFHAYRCKNPRDFSPSGDFLPPPKAQ